MFQTALLFNIRMACKGHSLFATIAQEVERNIGNVEVTGSTPVSSF